MRSVVHRFWLVAAVSLAMCATALADAGSLDDTLAGDGRVTTGLGSPEEGAIAVAVQPDGKLVVLGLSGDNAVLVRYTAAGAPDTTFDRDGVRFFAGIEPADVAVQPDGKIVVAGSAESPDFDEDFALARFDADGTFDAAFGDDGIAADDGSFNGNDHAHGLALQPDGKIVVVGSTDQESEGGEALVARFNGDGTADGSFGGADGRAVLFLGNHSSASAVSIQTNGKIVLAGEAWMETTGRRAAVARLNGAGRLDDSFGGDGRVRTGFGEFAAVAVQSDGRIVAAGSSAGDFAVARYTRRGRLDRTFSDDGRQRTDFAGGDDAAEGLVIQANGRVVLAGSAAPPRRPHDADFGVARYRTNGELDPTFSHNGKQRTRFGSNHWDYGTDAALQANGRIVVTGRVTTVPGDLDLGLARYLRR
jgi:uncharacterized delta-60 repeat protein